MEFTQFILQTLNIKNTEWQASIFIIFSSSYYHIGELDIATAYLKMVNIYDFPFVKENMAFITGQINAKRGNTNIAIQQLQQCLENSSYKINVVNALLDIYLERKEWITIEKLILQEHDFLEINTKQPIHTSECAAYYKKKSKYYGLLSSFDNHIKFLFKSATIYASIDTHEKAYDCFQIICEAISQKSVDSELSVKIITLFNEFKKYSNKEVLK